MTLDDLLNLAERYILLAILAVDILIAAIAIGLNMRRAKPRWPRWWSWVGAITTVLLAVAAGWMDVRGDLGWHLSLRPKFIWAIVLAGPGLAMVLCAIGHRRTIQAALLAIPFGVAGGFMLVHPGLDEPEEELPRTTLTASHQQLVELKALLVAYKAKHGRYPDSDQGLGVLDTFSSRFPVRFCRNPSSLGDHVPWFGCGSEITGGAIRDLVTRHDGITPQLPRSEGDLRVLLRLYEWDLMMKNRTWQPVSAELGLASSGEAFVIHRGHVLSPTWVAYVYENRRGLPASSFRDSPAHADPRRLYSVEVDDCVYVSSVEGELAASRLDEFRRRRDVLRASGGALLVPAIALFVLCRRSAGALLFGAAVLTLAAAVGTNIHLHMGMVPCYTAAPHFGYRDPATLVRREALLDKYRAAGVISEETRRKAVAAMRPELPPDPAGRPVTTNRSDPRSGDPRINCRP